MVVNSGKEGNVAGSEHKKIYSTSVTPPELTDAEDYEDHVRSVPGFKYSRANLNGHESAHVTVSDKIIVGDVIEKDDGSSESSEDFHILPEEGFPPVTNDWKSRVKLSGKLQSETSSKQYLFVDNDHSHPQKNTSELSISNNIHESLNSYSQPDELVFSFPAGEIISCKKHTQPDSNNLPHSCSFPSGTICKHRTDDCTEASIVSKDINYTINELLVMTRSTVPSMRSHALEYLTTICRNLYNNVYPATYSHSIHQTLNYSNIALCARVALDDSYISAVVNGLVLLLILTFSSDESLWDLLDSNYIFLSPDRRSPFHCTYNPFSYPSSNPQTDNISLEQVVKLLKKDLIQGLIASNICNRFCHLLSVYKQDTGIGDMILQILVRMSRHSPEVVDILLNSTTLFQRITDNYLKINLDPLDTSSKISATTNSVKFLKILASVSPVKTSAIITRNDILTIIARFLAPEISLPTNFTPELLNLKKECWLLYAYSLGHDHSPKFVYTFYEFLQKNADYVLKNISPPTNCFSPHYHHSRAFLIASISLFTYISAQHPLYPEILTFLSFIFCHNSSIITNGYVSKLACDFVRTVFTTIQPGSTSEMLKRPGSAHVQAITIFFKLASGDALNIILNNLKTSIDECEELLCKITTNNGLNNSSNNSSSSESELLLTTYGIGSLDRKKLVSKMIALNNKCEEWAAICGLCAVLSKHHIDLQNFSNTGDFTETLRYWMFSSKSMKLVSYVANLDSIILKLMYNGEFISWFMHGASESLLEYVYAFEKMEDIEALHENRKELEDILTPLLHKVLMIQMPHNADSQRFRCIPDRLFDMVYLSPLAGNLIKGVNMKIKKNIFSSIFNSIVGNANQREHIYSVAWPISILDCANLSKIANNNALLSSASKDELETNVLYLLKFNELIDMFYSSCRIGTLLQKPWEITPELYVTRFLHTYDLFLLPLNIGMLPNYSDALSKIMVSLSNYLIGKDISLHYILKEGFFFKKFMQVTSNFKSSSYGDNICAKYLTFMLRNDISSKYKFFFFEELEDVMFLFETYKEGPLSSFCEKDINTKIHEVLEYENKYWFSCSEIDVRQFALYFKLIATLSLKKRSFIRAMAVSYISNALFEKRPVIDEFSIPLILTPQTSKDNFSDTNSCQEPMEKYTILKKQVAQFIFEKEENSTWCILCDEILSWKDWPSYYYGEKQSESVCASRRAHLESLLFK